MIVLGGCDKPADVVWVAPGSTPGVLLGGRDGWGEVYPLGAQRMVAARRMVRASRASWTQGAWADRCKVGRRAVVTRCPTMENRRSRSRSGFQRLAWWPVNASSCIQVVILQARATLAAKSPPGCSTSSSGVPPCSGEVL